MCPLNAMAYLLRGRRLAVNIYMGTLGGFPSPPALWLWLAKPAFAYAIMGTLEAFARPRPTVRHARF